MLAFVHKVSKQSLDGKMRSQAGAWEREEGAQCAPYMAYRGAARTAPTDDFHANS
jgi:hypothetical protein